MATALTIWANPFLTESAEELLVRSTAAHHLILAQKPEHVLDVGTMDPRLLQAEIVFGQPDVEAILQSEMLRWIQISSAGYTRYDTEEVRSFLKKRSAIMTNSSSVFDEPCAEHLMAWLLADARQLYPSFENQRGSRGWPQNYLRENIRLLADADHFHRGLWRDRTTVSRASRAVSGPGHRLSAHTSAGLGNLASSDRRTLQAPWLKQITSSTFCRITPRRGISSMPSGFSKSRLELVITASVAAPPRTRTPWRRT